MTIDRLKKKKRKGNVNKMIDGLKTKQKRNENKTNDRQKKEKKGE